MPWLFYLNTNQDYILNNSASTFTYNFDTNGADSSNDRSTLQFFVRKLTLDGQLVSELPLTNQLTPCYFSSLSSQRLTKYGNYSIETCSINLKQQFFSEPQFFYELFLKTGQTTFTDVPVAISGYVAQAGDKPNSNGVPSDVSSMRFFRRFFIYDKISGIPGTSRTDLYTKQPQFIRVLQSAYVHIRVVVEQIDGEVKHRIKKPFVLLNYKDVKNATAPSDLSSELMVGSDDLQFKYSSDIGSFTTTISGLFIGANLLALVILVCKLTIWYQYNPYDFLNENFYSTFFQRFIIDLMTIWSFTMFWFLFFVSGYWFIFFKWEKHVFTFMPLPTEDLDSYMNWRVVFWIMFGGMCFQAAVLVWEQNYLDYFFIDWEKLKNSPMTKEEFVEMAKKDHTLKRGDRAGSLLNSQIFDNTKKDEHLKKPDSEQNLIDSKTRVIEFYKKSAWRNIVIANEFNELFGLRYINIPFVFLLYAVVMSGYNYENLAATNTYTTRDIGKAPLNYVLKFFISTSLFIFIGGGYYSNLASLVIRRAIAFKVATPLMNFVDLCSMANISIFVFQSFCHGYYIHGVGFVSQAQPCRGFRRNSRRPQGSSYQGVKGQLQKQRITY